MTGKAKKLVNDEDDDNLPPMLVIVIYIDVTEHLRIVSKY